jgi:hypothetical protein
MRFSLVLVTLALIGTSALAQDASTLVIQQAQQAAQAAQQANQQAMLDAQRASQNAQQAMQNAQTSATQNQYVRAYPARPKFSIGKGTYSSPVTVKLKSSRGATIYYTTDGWTPTKDSIRYTGPITIDSTTTLQAVAIYQDQWRSMVASALYTLPQAAPVSSPTVSSTPVSSPEAQSLSPTLNTAIAPAIGKRMLTQGMPVHLVFASDINSKTADVGDKIPLTLADDLKIGDVVLVRKGAPAVATVTEADGTHMLGVAGEIAFQAESLNVDGVLVKLRGGATKDGQGREGAALSAMFVPVAGPFLVHGHHAEIKRGTSFLASVSEDTPLPPIK